MIQHLTPEERDMIGCSCEAATEWVWTEVTERIYPDRIAGLPVPEPHRKMAPQLWVHRGYVREADQPQQMKIEL